MPRGGHNKIKDEDFNRMFNKVIELVEMGVTVRQACKKIGLSDASLYKKMSLTQSKQLKLVSLSDAKSTKGGIGVNFKIINYFSPEDLEDY